MKLSVVMAYASSLGILCSLLILLCGLGAESSIIASRIWLANWSSTNVTTSQQRDTFLGVYGALGLGQVLLFSVMSIVLAYSSMKAARKLHQGLLVNIMHLPMQFFETTPIGRIVNRFSKDVNYVDDKFPRSLGIFLRTLFSALGTIFVISYSTPLFLTCVLPLGALYGFIQVRSRGSSLPVKLQCIVLCKSNAKRDYFVALFLRNFVENSSKFHKASYYPNRKLDKNLTKRNFHEAKN